MKNEENINKLRAIVESGVSVAEAARQMDLSYNTARFWLYPDENEKHIGHTLKWLRENREKAGLNQKEWRSKQDMQYRAVAAEKQRRRYRNNPAYRNSLKRLAKRYRRTIQGWLAARLRTCTLGHAGRYPLVHNAMLTAITGKTRDEFSALFIGEGSFDHQIPLSAFDLKNPQHLVRAMHHTNIQLIPRKDNELKGKRIPEGLDIMSLQWAGTDSAIEQAQVFIAHGYTRLARMS